MTGQYIPAVFQNREGWDGGWENGDRKRKQCDMISIRKVWKRGKDNSKKIAN